MGSCSDLTSMHLLRHSLSPISQTDTDCHARMQGLADNLDQLSACWGRLQGQVSTIVRCRCDVGVIDARYEKYFTINN